MHQLRIPARLRRIDVLAGETKSDSYLAISPTGVVPFLRLPGGHGLSESNAMLWLIAEGSTLVPTDAYARAKGLQWSFFEQSRLEPFISPARFLTSVAPDRGIGRDADIAKWRTRAHTGLSILDRYLAESDFIAGPDYSIADIGVFGYVHVAPEGGIGLDAYPAVQAWIARVQATPGFVPMSVMNSRLRRSPNREANSAVRAA